MTLDKLLVEALEKDYTTAPITAQERVMLDYVVKLTRDATKVSKNDHARLRATGFDDKALEAAVASAGYPKAADPSKINYAGVLAILLVLMIYVTMVYGPIAAFLVESFPTQIRYTSMSFPYHIGNGWFGGFLPLIVASITAATGNFYSGLWYPIGVALMTFIIGSLFTRDNIGRDLRHETRIDL